MNTLKPEFVEFKTEDNLTLPGLLYEPTRAKAVAIYLHGNGSSSVFYSAAEHQHAMATALNDKGVAILYFNNRGAHLIHGFTIKKKGEKTRKRYGMGYEEIKDCISDIDGAISFLKKRGYKKFYLMGISTGANKICVYNFYKPKNEIEKYILLGGGDDTGIHYHLLGKSKFLKLLSISKRKIAQGRGEDIIPEMLPTEIFSYTGFRDIANPDGDYNVFPFYEAIKKVKLSTKPHFRYFESIKKPAMVVYGGADEYAWGDVDRVIRILKSYRPEFTYKIVKGSNHSFRGHQKELSGIVANFLASKNHK
jgi:dipeptidyl aminopeptidase/acylaminoacyl peptidase